MYRTEFELTINDIQQNNCDNINNIVMFFMNKCFVSITRLVMTLSNGNIFRVTGPFWGEFTGHRRISLQGPVTRSFDVFFDLRLNKRLNKHSRHQ